MTKGLRNWRHEPTPPAMAVLTDLLGRRWALRVVWELRAGAMTFRALQATCGGISPSVMQTRLHELKRLGVVESIPRLGYRLSASGEELYRDLEPLGSWAEAHKATLQLGDK